MITAVVGLVLGILTGYFFEWRTSRETRELNAELQAKLHTLRESIYAVGRGDSPDEHAGPSLQKAAMEEAIQQWVLAYQGPDGTIPRLRVVQRFLEHGFTGEQINAALTQLDERGIISLGQVIEVR